jgi:membrane-bound lytic murein transglycosylase
MELSKATKEMMAKMGVKMDANMKANKEERKAEMKAYRNDHVQEIVDKTVRAIEDKMETLVHSIRSERDGKIQRRIENDMERQENPKEEATVHIMRA